MKQAAAEDKALLRHDKLIGEKVDAVVASQPPDWTIAGAQGGGEDWLAPDADQQLQAHHDRLPRRQHMQAACFRI